VAKNLTLADDCEMTNKQNGKSKEGGREGGGGCLLFFFSFFSFLFFSFETSGEKKKEKKRKKGKHAKMFAGKDANPRPRTPEEVIF